MAQINLAASVEHGERNLRENEYPGRLIAMGRSTCGDVALQAYALTGRSEGSKQRQFVTELQGAAVRTTAIGKTAAEMAATPMAGLIYYRAQNSLGLTHVVTNGAQTEPATAGLSTGLGFKDAIANYPPVVDGVDLSSYEPDAPNFTPRITGLINYADKDQPRFALGHIRRHPDSGDKITTVFSTPLVEDIDPGVGYVIQTYSGNGNPLPSFDQEPYAIPFGADAQETAEGIWDMLNPDVRVAVFVRAIDIVRGRAIAGDSGLHIINGMLPQ